MKIADRKWREARAKAFEAIAAIDGLNGIGRVSVIRDERQRGLVICATCDRRSTYIVCVDGAAWSTTCRRHLHGILASANFAFPLDNGSPVNQDDPISQTG